MALSGKLNADFASFFEACQQAQVELQGFDTETKNVEKSLNRMVEDFSGKAVQVQAALMVEAVERIGGASKLTEDELQRVAKTSAEAAEKMKAMGQDVPEGIAKFAKEVKVADTATAGFGTALSTATGVLGAFGISLGVDALIGFAKGAISSAAALGDLSVVTGVATDDLQKLGYVGAEFGVGTEEIGKAVGELNKKIVAGDKGFRDLGLSVEDLKKAGPTEAFLQFAEAASRIEDPMQKNVIVAGLLNDKLAKQLIPGLADLRDKMNEVPKEALISEETIKAANEFEATMGRMLIKAEALALKGIMFTVDRLKALGQAFSETSGPMDNVNFTKYLDGAGNLASRTTTATNSMVALTGTTSSVITNTDILANRLTALREEALEPLTTSQKASILELADFGLTHSEIAPLVEASEAAVRRFMEADKAAAETAKQDAANIEAGMKSLAAFRDSAEKRQMEIVAEEKKRALERAAMINAEVAAELAATVKRNEMFNLDAAGNVKVTDATEVYRQKLEELHRTKEEGVSQVVREQALLDEYTNDEIKAAKAVDEATQAFWKARDAVKAKGDEVETATKKTGVYMNQLHMLVSDPKLAAFFGGNVAANTLYSGGQGGFTPEEAAAIGAGQFINMAGVGQPGLGMHKRAEGGPVKAGQWYVVGERGPELFVPDQGGSIMANGGGGRAGVGDTITINISHPLGTPEAIARAVGDALTTRSRAIGQRL